MPKERGAHVFFITPVCNNRCLMCCSPINQQTMTEHPSLEGYIKKEVDKLGEMNEIYFTGGEPTSHPDIFRIIEYIKTKNQKARINIVTNGRMFFYEKISRKFAKIGINKIVTEIHGPDAKLHDAVTRTPGSFKQTTEGIKNLINLGQNIELRIVVHKMNYQQLPETAQYISDKLCGVNKIIIFPFNIISHGLKNRNKLQIKFSDISPYFEKAVDILRSSNMNVELYHTPFCVIDKKYWNFVKDITAEDYKIASVEECERCLMRKKCPLIWKSYVKYNGKEEFSAILET